jgi:hypothetical protein
MVMVLWRKQCVRSEVISESKLRDIGVYVDSFTLSVTSDIPQQFYDIRQWIPFQYRSSWVSITCMQKLYLNIEISQAQWLAFIILGTQEAEIQRIIVWGQPKQKVQEIPSQTLKVGQSGMNLSPQICKKYK